ncbi:phage tail assembly protein T [Pseudomonas alabamensis]|uniref:phage tail assembly protein T n=1 Tax=Pseudomonas alabamensis TaxID=3064349 RepID=UPI003F64F5C7
MREFQAWAKYRERRGSLNVGMRVERVGGLLASIMANQTRNQKVQPTPFTPQDFTPHDQPRPISLEQAMEAWQ